MRIEPDVENVVTLKQYQTHYHNLARDILSLDNTGDYWTQQAVVEEMESVLYHIREMSELLGIQYWQQ